jgi:hypothetical protein
MNTYQSKKINDIEPFESKAGDNSTPHLLVNKTEKESEYIDSQYISDHIDTIFSKYIPIAKNDKHKNKFKNLNGTTLNSEMFLSFKKLITEN